MSKATLKFIRLSPTKARLIAREVQGMNAELALASLEFTPNKAAKIISKVIASAVANGDFEPEEVEIVSCRVDKGPVLKRFRPRARGSASRILKPTSHIMVEVAPASAKSEPKKDAKATKKAQSKKSEPKKESKTTKKAETKNVEQKESKPSKKAETKKSEPQKSEAKESKTATKIGSSTKATDLTDLKLLSGVGPAVERSLKAEGVESIEQIAKMSKKDIEELDKNIGIKGDIANSWPSEAKEILKNAKKES